MTIVLGKFTKGENDLSVDQKKRFIWYYGSDDWVQRDRFLSKLIDKAGKNLIKSAWLNVL